MIETIICGFLMIAGIGRRSASKSIDQLENVRLKA